MANYCSKCWHEGCSGNCKTPEQRKAAANAKAIQAIVRSRSKDKAKKGRGK